jgi:hypothetical protein
MAGCCSDQSRRLVTRACIGADVGVGVPRSRPISSADGFLAVYLAGIVVETMNFSISAIVRFDGLAR